MRYNGSTQELDKYGSTTVRLPLSPALAYAAEDDRAPSPFLVYGLGGKAAVQTSRRGGMGEFLAWTPELGGGVRGKKREGGWNPSFLHRHGLDTNGPAFDHLYLGHISEREFCSVERGKINAWP